jgi:hypothetical protein
VSGVRAWTALGSIALLSLGCQADIDGTGEPDGPEIPNGGSGGGAGTGGTDTLDRDAIGSRCEETQLAPPQLRRLTAPELDRTLRDVLPPLASGWQGVRLGADPASSLGFSNDARMLVVAPQTAQDLLGTAEDVATLLSSAATLGSLVPCAAEAAPGRACAEQVAQTLGAKLFRRPVAAGEVSEYGALFDSVSSKSDFATGAKWMLVAMIQSPSTIYRSELGTGSGTRKLDPYELASELSYTFGGTVPSAALVASAERGELAAPEARVAAAKQLLQTPAGLEQLRTFLAEWSGYGRIASKTKTTVEGFDTLRESMLQETAFFLGEAVVNRRGGIRELLTANYTFLNGPLAALYGFGPTGASGFELTERPAGRGLGLLAQGSILAGSAHSDASSPTLRGLVVYERLLCHQRIKPPPGIPTLESPTPGVTTTRQRYEVSHGGKPGCAACHQYFDPIGYGFEHFDEAGRYRENEQSLAIDASGKVLSSPDGQEVFVFNGLDDLTTQLAGQQDVADCVSGLAAAYAFAGAGGRACLAEDARAKFAKGELGVMDYYAELAAAPSVVERR